MSRRDAKALHAQLAQFGFVLVRDARHRVYRHPAGGPQLVVSATASDHRSTQNTLADARRIVRGLGAAR